MLAIQQEQHCGRRTVRGGLSGAGFVLDSEFEVVGEKGFM